MMAWTTVIQRVACEFVACAKVRVSILGLKVDEVRPSAPAAAGDFEVQAADLFDGHFGFGFHLGCLTAATTKPCNLSLTMHGTPM